MVWVLENIYEVDFLGFSHGFGPGKSQHNALDARYVAITQKKVSYLLDADIKLIEQNLRAGIIDKDQWSRSETGIPQGGVLSPLLANSYRH